MEIHKKWLSETVPNFVSSPLQVRFSFKDTLIYRIIHDAQSIFENIVMIILKII